MKEAVIVVPGIMGSVLKVGGTTIWPGGVTELLLPYRHMNELLGQNVQATDIIREFAIVEQYGALVTALETCGFHEGATPQTLKVFPYDWRKDNALAADGLADCIDGLVAQLGADSEINLVAHSMGGLVSRYYLESGRYSTRGGYGNVRRLITLGTPHRGAPIALPAAMGQERRLFLSAAQVKQLASHPAFPSLYQLLPPPGEPFASDRGGSARLNPVDIYDTAIASQLGLITENLASAAGFHARLDLSAKPKTVRYFFFVGTQKKTVTSAQLQRGGAAARAIKIEREDGGDGTVPVWSGSLTGVQMEPVGGEHGELYKNGGLQRVLAELLGKPGMLLAAGLVPEMSVAEKVVDPEATTTLTIDFPTGTRQVDGELRFRLRLDAMGVEHDPSTAIKTYPVSYIGAAIDHLAVLVDAPSYAGVYEIAFVPTGGHTPLATTELLVQSG